MTLRDFRKLYPANQITCVLNGMDLHDRITIQDARWEDALDWQCCLFADYSGDEPRLIPVAYSPKDAPEDFVGQDLTNPRYRLCEGEGGKAYYQINTNMA